MIKGRTEMNNNNSNNKNMGLRGSKTSTTVWLGSRTGNTIKIASNNKSRKKAKPSRGCPIPIIDLGLEDVNRVSFLLVIPSTTCTGYHRWHFWVSQFVPHPEQLSLVTQVLMSLDITSSDPKAILNKQKTLQSLHLTACVQVYLQQWFCHADVPQAVSEDWQTRDWTSVYVKKTSCIYLCE